MQETMGRWDIAFPHLGLYFKDVPKSFSVFGFEIAYYGVFIAIGMLSGIFLAQRRAKKSGQDPEMYGDFAIYAIIASVLGARIFYVIFAWESYRNNFWSVFNIREGGLAIYGGVIMAFVSAYVYCKIKKKSALLLLDTAVPGLILGQIIGRLGNFMNREVFGEYTNSFLAMRLPTAAVRASDVSAAHLSHMVDGTNYIQVHPTFLYEMLWNGLILTIMLLYTKHKKFTGEISLIYLGGYGLGRGILEGIRTDRLTIPGTELYINQILAFSLFAFSLITWIVIRVKLYQKTKKQTPTP
ncbi:MAG: prolipoprotein diacylglyceryl transferase [Clostridium sp.]|jgi:phosphatidylglycerol:prolipoprotein diacylglycerol transferase|nr:prolipoprotein diacylglyceryl transferase [Clostridium sp.]